MKKIIFAFIFIFYCNLHSTDSSVSMYLDLLKQLLTGYIYKDPDVVRKAFNPNLRLEGRDWPLTAETMIGIRGLNNIQYCIEQIIKDKIEGDFIETGVWRGGSTIFMKGVLKANNINDKNIWVADSFQGVPPPNPKEYPADKNLDLFKYKFLSVSLDVVKKNFMKYDLLDDRIIFLKGWFKDTLPTAPIKKLSLLRLDGDLYASTIQVLNVLYPKLSVGGYVIIDDYGVIDACKAAVSDYRKKNNITEQIIQVGWSAVYWKKNK